MFGFTVEFGFYVNTRLLDRDLTDQNEMKRKNCILGKCEGTRFTYLLTISMYFPFLTVIIPRMSYRIALKLKQIVDSDNIFFFLICKSLSISQLACKCDKTKIKYC